MKTSEVRQFLFAQSGGLWLDPLCIDDDDDT